MRRVKVRFLIVNDIAQAFYSNKVMEIKNLVDLNTFLKSAGQLDRQTLRNIGALAIFFAALEVMKTGQDLSSSNLMKTLDEFYFVLHDSADNKSLELGMERATDQLRNLQSLGRERDFFLEISKLM